MKKWPVGEIRRIERAYSPKGGYYGFWMLRSFIKNIPQNLVSLIVNNPSEVLLVQNTTENRFKLFGSYSYNDLPIQYRDSRGQYVFKNGQMEYPYKFYSWSDDMGMVTGFPLRPWINIKAPCSMEEFYDTKNDERTRAWLTKTCQSPIEVKFAHAALSKGLNLRPQFWIETKGGWYRADFAIPYIKIAVEIDGQEFHSTKEQRTYDAQRQRDLEIEGWKVIRFTGTEVHQNAFKCVDEFSKIANITNAPRKSLFDF
jgi:very-short-patch-repair endonuclease